MTYGIRDGRITYSTGSTGTPKKIWHSELKLNLACEVYKRTHNLNSRSSILNFLTTDHIGGLMMNLAGEYVGCKVTQTKLNPFSYLDKLRDYSHTMLTDSTITALRKVKQFDDYDFTDKFLHVGTEPHTMENIIALVERGATVFCNWGMTEIGPVCVNTTFEPYDVDRVKRYFEPGALLGDNFEIEWKIDDGELVVRSEVSIYKDWYYTGDNVKYENDTLYFIGRR